MSSPFIGEIRMFAGNFAPVGWAFCDGSLIPISENDTLFNLIGTTYGGDGQETFALPNLQSRLPIHFGNGFTLADTGGAEAVTLTTSTIPAHTHPFLASSDTATSANPGGGIVARSPQIKAFRNANPTLAMDQGFVGSVGGSQPHSNLQPFLCVNFIISLFGVFPTQA